MDSLWNYSTATLSKSASLTGEILKTGTAIMAVMAAATTLTAIIDSLDQTEEEIDISETAYILLLLEM